MPLLGVRRFDRADLRPLRKLRRRDGRPVRAVIGRHVHQTVGRAGPEHVSVERGDGERGDVGERFRAGLIRSRPARRVEPSVVGSLRVRSGLMIFHVWPWSMLEKTTCAATSSSRGSAGEKKIGCVQPKRYFVSADVAPAM